MNEALYTKDMKSPILILMIVSLGSLSSMADDYAVLENQTQILQGKLKSMSHGYHSEKEWNELDREIETISHTAREQGRLDLLVKLKLSQAHVLNTVFKRDRDAVQMLDQLLVSYPQTREAEFRRLYIVLGEMLASMGDEQAIRNLVTRYRHSPLFDPPPLAYNLTQTGPYAQPAIHTRAGGNSSITVTALENALLKAQQADGRLAPGFTVTDRKGRTHVLAAYKGEMILLDFFNPRWPSWSRQIDELKEVFNAFKDRGLNILGIPLNPSFASEINLPWPVVASPGDVLKTYRVFGEPINILIDQDGRILRKNVRPDEVHLILLHYLKTEL